MSEFERELPSFRLAQIHHGDDLPTIAGREMGDANRWPELVWLNSLTHPYVTDNAALASSSVLLSGAFIRVPAPVGLATGDTDAGRVFERDCLLTAKALTVDDGGDLAVVTGADNLRQQLSHLIGTPRGQARRHPEYGCLIWRLVGTVNGPAASLMGAEYVRSALRSDYRVSSVSSSDAEVVGDAVRITARAIAIEGGVVDVAIN